MKFFFGLRSIKCKWFGIVFVFYLLKKKIMKKNLSNICVILYDLKLWTRTYRKSME